MIRFLCQAKPDLLVDVYVLRLCCSCVAREVGGQRQVRAGKPKPVKKCDSACPFLSKSLPDSAAHARS